jgi:S1-C subfamily serine protease
MIVRASRPDRSRRRGLLGRSLLLALAVELAVAAAGCGSSEQGGAGTGPSSTAANAGTRTVSTQAKSTTTAAVAFPDLVAKIRGGVVRIEVTTCATAGVGTGIVVGPRLVATVEHVIDEAVSMEIKRNGKVLATGTVIGTDPDRDLALVRTSKPIKGYRFQLAKRPAKLGEPVAALGYPLGLPLTVTRGSVSGLDRTIPIEGLRRRKLVQTDAALNPGNSGGPLISADTGEVLGLVDLGSLRYNGLAFAVSAEVAGPLLEAWTKAPQPIRAASCPGRQFPTPSTARGREPGVGVPAVYVGRFTSVDRLQRCNATVTYVYCSSGPSRRAVKLEVGKGITDYGMRGSVDRGAPSMPEGTAFRTPSGAIECDSSSRGITCTDRTTGAYFILGDYRLIVSKSGQSTSSGSAGVPSSYSGYFAAVDRLERCYADDSFAVCTAGPSGKGVRLVVGSGASYEGITGSTDKGGPAMPIGSSFTTPGGNITCSSSSRGITCKDVATGAYFTIGDYHVRVNNGAGEVVH